MRGRTGSTTIGVLTLYAGGFYHGTLLGGIHTAARCRGAHVVALQAKGLDLLWPTERNSHPLAMNAVDGWIVVGDLEREGYLERLRAASKPMVYIHSQPAGPNQCWVMPDNRGGMLMAVKHLVGHGHRKIAFAGSLKHTDIRERYDGYLEGLRQSGIKPDPRLFFSGAGNLELDGRQLGHKLIEARLGCSAVVAATDKNALGIIAVLKEAGYRIPGDLAVVGFDDLEPSQYMDPPLSTVRQHFDVVAMTAAEKLLDWIENGKQPPPEVRVPTELVPRASCGCHATALLVGGLDPAPAEGRENALTRALLDLAGSRQLRPLTRAHWPGARRIASFLNAVVEERGAPRAESLTGAWREFLDLNRDVDSIEGMIALLEDTGRAWLGVAAEDDPRREQLALTLRQFRIELMRNWRALEQVRSKYYDFVAEANANINATLAGGDFSTAKDLTWLKWTRTHYGCLGLWSPASEDRGRRLSVVSNYSSDGASSALLNTDHAPENFPPPEALELIRRYGNQNIMTLVPVIGKHQNRGLLAVIGPVEVELREHVGSLRDWARLVGAALERHEIELELRNSALTDALTGLPNRALLMDRLEQATQARYQPAQPALLFLDLDHFKRINDSLGHLKGDELLVMIAERLQGALNKEQTIARLGGDEFAVLLPSITDESQAVNVAQAMHDALESPFVLNGDPVFTSCSIGIAFSSERHTCAADFLRDADTALYRAKLKGRARHEIFTRGMHAEAVERLHLDARLRKALEENEFTLHYQPLVSLASEKISGLEALIRWDHPEQGCLLPSRFLTIAEEVGLAIPISRWVIEKACGDAKRWRDAGLPHVCVSVNVPPLHLKDPTFAGLIQDMLSSHGLPPSALGVELVESTLIENQSATARLLHRLKQLGVRTSIDDFGTGYSSLSYLKQFPVDVLKIDRDFMRGVPNDPYDTAISSAIIAMAQGLNLTVVAEGVEHLQQVDFLRRHGCDVVQGNLVSQPLPADQCADFLRNPQFDISLFAKLAAGSADG